MSLRDCIQRGIDDGEIDRARGEYAQEMWRDLSDRYANSHPRHVAEGLAAEDVRNALRKEFGQKRHEYLARMADIRKAQGDVARAQDLAALPTQTLWSKADSPDRFITDAESLHRGLVERFNWRLQRLLKDHHRDLLGSPKKPERLENVLREMKGENTGDVAARETAQSVAEALEELRHLYNEVGGSIGKRENWGVSHTHNRRALIRAGFDTWFDNIRVRLDWNKIEDHMTGRPFAEAGAEPPMDVQRRFLTDIYNNITTDGASQITPQYGVPHGAALYRRRNDPRVLEFRSADDWMSYNREFGTGNLLSSIVGHAHMMARDIALMRALGPRPQAGLDYRIDLALQRAAKDGNAALAEQIRASGDHAKRMLNIYTSHLQPKTATQEAIAKGFATARTLMTGAMLSRAILANLTDANTMRLAAQSIGMNPANIMGRQFRAIASQSTRDDLLRAGHIAATLADPGVATARFLSEYPPSEMAERVTNAVMRLQLLSAHTDFGRASFRLEMEGLIAGNAGRPLDQVDAPLRQRLAAYGITEQDWRHFTDPRFLHTTEDGATFASPITWRYQTDLPQQQAEAVFEKFSRMIEREVEMAVPMVDLEARAYFEGRWEPGTFMYEVAKSGLMFKSFPLTFHLNQFRRTMAQGTNGDRARYLASLMAGATLMGAFVLQISDLLRGRDLRPMDNPSFWAAAFIRGGGGGPLADLAMAGQTSWGGGFASYLTGPIPQLAQDMWGLSIGNATRAAQGEDTRLAQDISRFGRRYTPGNVPWFGPTLDRLVWDQLQIYLDPESVQALERSSKWREEQFGNQEWWVPGDTSPRRGPTLDILSR